MNYIGQLTEKLLFVVLGFLLGTGATLMVDVVRERRRRIALIEIMRAEVRAFINACRSAIKFHSRTSSNVRRLTEIIVERYSQDPIRLTACKSLKFQLEAVNFYLECSAFLDLMSMSEKIEKSGKSSEYSAVGPGTYEGIINRSEKYLSFFPS